MMRPPPDVRSAPRPSWTRKQIRAARGVELAPLLEQRGLALRERGAENWEVIRFPGLVVKASYWRWPDKGMAGNAIDFYTRVLGASFHDAMRELLGR